MCMIKRTSRYSQLQGRRALEKKEYYEGVYEGHPIRFDRKFREYRFTDMECDALCHGEWLEVHNLMNGTVKYGVLGSLEKDMFWKPDGLSSMPVYVFKSRKPLLNNDSYDFKNRTIRYGMDGSSGHMPEKDANILRGSDSNTEAENKMITSLLSDNLSNEEDAKLAAMVAAPNLPPIRAISTTDGSVPIYVPVLGNMVFGKDGITVLDERVPDVEPVESALDEITEDSLSEHIVIQSKVIDESEQLMADYVPYDVAADEGLELEGDDIVDYGESDDVFDESLNTEVDDLAITMSNIANSNDYVEKSLEFEEIIE